MEEREVAMETEFKYLWPVNKEVNKTVQAGKSGWRRVSE